MRITEIDQVIITVLVDNYSDLLMTGSHPVMERPTVPYGEVLLAEHGLSLHLRLISQGSSFSLLMDAGASKISLLYNAARLGLDLHTIQGLVISHGHDDHVGSAEEVIRMAGAPLPVYIHPAAFSRREKRLPDGTVVEMSPPDMDAMSRAGAAFYPTPGPVSLWDDRILVSGTIDRTVRFERTNPVYFIEKEGQMVPDLFDDDQAVILNLKGKGLVVITGCAHAGIINTLTYAKKITGIHTVHAVIGGFHLSGSFFSPIISETIHELKQIHPTWIVPLHCTGWEAINRMIHEMPEEAVLNTVGTVYRFGG